MKEQNYGRIVMTTSSSGLYGNFGQTNYGAAKMGLIGLMNTLVLEGGKYNIHVNALSPTANTRMTEDLLPAPMLDLMTAESVTAGALTLCHDKLQTGQFSVVVLVVTRKLAFMKLMVFLFLKRNKLLKM